MHNSELRVVIVASNANTRFGGEAILPWHYFRLLRIRGVDAHLVTHERNRDDLLTHAVHESDRIHFTSDRWSSQAIQRAGRSLPQNVKPITIWWLMSVVGAADLRRTARALCRAAPGPLVVHEPIPVSPRRPSLMTRMGAPVVIGPLNGGLSYPAGFRADMPRLERAIRAVSRLVSEAANRIADGKRRAAIVLVANPRTRSALPRTIDRDVVVEMVENGVDLSTFGQRSHRTTGDPRFAFVGRLVDWKRVDLLLAAMTKVPENFRLDVIGDGPMRSSLEQLAAEYGVSHRTTFHGLLTQDECSEALARCDGLVLPSIYECGGAVVLEAMATGIPVIATDWGGPADYVIHDVTGVLLAPDSPDLLVERLAAAMRRLGVDRALAWEMGRAGRARVEAHFDWEHKIDRVLEIYREVAHVDGRT